MYMATNPDGTAKLPKCPNCKGTGREDEGHPCAECDATGELMGDEDNDPVFEDLEE